MAACQTGVPCPSLCANERDKETCTSECALGAIRTRSQIPMGVKVKHHAYIVPLFIAVALGFVAWKKWH